jgi:hydrogenase maturation protease
MNDLVQEQNDQSPHSAYDKGRRRGARLLVLGIGNLLMGDDGVGVHVARELRKYPRAGVLVTEIGSAILEAVPLLTWADRVLVIDALMAHGPPGTIYFAPFERIASQPRKKSLHELDLGTALSFLPDGCSQPEVFVLGVQPANLDWSLDLSPEVLRALPHAVTHANEQLRQWRRAVRFCREVHDE